MISETFNMDCIEGMKQYPDKYFDLAVVDIEYNIGASKPTKKPAVCKQKNGSKLRVNQVNYTHKNWDFVKSSPEYFNELFRVSKKQIVWGGNYYGLSGGYLVWDKLNGESDQFGCELAWVSFSKRTDIVYYLWSGMIQGKTCSKSYYDAMNQEGDKSKNEKRFHPTQKPVKLYDWILKNYAKDGDKILDTHLGSQSSRISAWKAKLDFVGFETDIDYFKQGNKRFEDFKKQLTLF